MERKELPVGSLLRFPEGNEYIITGQHIASGGGGLVYPAKKIAAGSDGESVLDYVIKECFPLADDAYFRNDSGEIQPDRDLNENGRRLEKIKEQFLREAKISQTVFKEANRVLPVRDTAEQVVLELPGKAPETVKNAYSVMDSLSGKGLSLKELVQEMGSLSMVDAFRLIRQLLYAIREIHNAGYLHLDVQYRNIFVNGALSDGSETITMIDFGSARKLCGDGKTEAFIDRELFTTPGFTAPEIYQKNDGTLRLGKEADIYSIGCLLFLLLTGEKPDWNRFLRVKNGKYLTNMKLRRLQCPSHLADSLQNILAKALATEPENRFASTDEMLNKVSEFLAAIQPFRSDLSNTTFDAFITYKHSHLDSSAAKALQQRLEAYRNPRGKREERRPIKRVFVDETELSSCADMGEQIREALKNSGWLIVLCSPETPHSTWVSEEIDCFLQYHDRSRVLAVLLSGTPESSFPKQLFASEGHGEVQAADARGENTKSVLQLIKRDAGLKVLAPMLGVTFESLKQRQKIRTIRQISAVLAVLLATAGAFSAYAVRKNIIISRQAQQIEEEYRNTVLQESKYLAELAERQYESGDVSEAVSIAVRALPSAEQDRPVIPLAQLVLERALGCYSLFEIPIVTATFHHDSSIINSEIFFDSDNSFLFTCDGDVLSPGYSFYIWDTNTNRLYYREKNSEETIAIFQEELLDTSNRRILYATNRRIICFDYARQHKIWDLPVPNIRTAFLSPKLDVVWLLTYDDLMSVNAETGNILEKISLSKVAIDDSSFDTVENKCFVSPDGRHIFFFLSDSFDFDQFGAISRLIIYDSHSGSFTVGKENFGLSAKACFLKNGNLLVSSVLQGGTKMTIGDQSLYRTEQVGIKLVQPDTGVVLWHHEDSSTGLFSNSGICTIPPAEGQPEQCLWYFGSEIRLFDSETGTLLRSYSVQGNIVNVTVSQGSDGVFLLAYTADGSVHNINFNTEDKLYATLFERDIAELSISDAFYARSMSDPNVVIKYEYKMDDNYVSLGTYGTNFSPEICFLGDGVLALTNNWRYDYTPASLILVDTSTDVTRRFTLKQVDDYDCPLEPIKINGIREVNGKRELCILAREKYSEDDAGYLVCVDLETGETSMENAHLGEIPATKESGAGVDIQPGQIRIADERGEPVCTIPYDSRLTVISADIVLDGTCLLVVYSDGRIVQYRIRDGQELNSAGDPISTIDKSHWRRIDDNLIALYTHGGYSGGMIVLDLSEETWGIRSAVTGAMEYDAEHDRFYYVYDGQFGYFPRYDVDTLIKMAEERW